MHKKSNTIIIAIIVLTVFIDVMGFGILIPIIPQLLTNPDSQFFLLPVGMTLEQGFILLGFLAATYPLGQFFSAPILGQLSDRYGRRKLLALSLFGTVISYLVFAYAIYTKNIPLMFVSRLFDGITGGNISIAQAALTDVTTTEKRSSGFGLIGAAYGLGFIAGPFIGGILSDPRVYSGFNSVTPFIFAAVLACVNMISVFLFFLETNKDALVSTTLKRFDWIQSLRNIRKAYALIELRMLFMVNFLFFTGFTLFTTFFSTYMSIKIGVHNTATIGNFFGFIGICVVVVQVLLVRTAALYLSEKNILRVSLIGSAISTLTYLLPRSLTGLYIATPAFAASVGLTQANMNSLISKRSPKHMEGEVMGINTSVQALGQIIAPAITGVLAAAAFLQTPIILGSILILAAGIIFWIAVKN